MADQPLESISVKALTDRCGIYRQTFYYHFHDIYDLLSLVYLQEKINKIEEVSSIQNMMEKIYAYYQENLSFVNATITSSAKDLFKEFIYNNCYQCFMILLDKIDETKIISASGKKSIARFYSSAYSSAILYALEIKKVKNFKQLLNETIFVDDEDLHISVKKMLRSELKKEK